MKTKTLHILTLIFGMLFFISMVVFLIALTLKGIGLFYESAFIEWIQLKPFLISVFTCSLLSGIFGTIWTKHVQYNPNKVIKTLTRNKDE